MMHGPHLIPAPAWLLRSNLRVLPLSAIPRCTPPFPALGIAETGSPAGEKGRPLTVSQYAGTPRRHPGTTQCVVHRPDNTHQSIVAGHSATPNEEEAPQRRLFLLNRARHDHKTSHRRCGRCRDGLGIQLPLPLLGRRLSPHLQPLVRGSHRCPAGVHGQLASFVGGVNRASACVDAGVPPCPPRGA